MARYTLNKDGRNMAQVQSHSDAQIAKWEAQGFKLIPGWLNLHDDDGPEQEVRRQERNRLLETWGWTVAEHSPLSNKQEWLAYLQELHKMMLHDEDFPEQPSLLYA